MQLILVQRQAEMMQKALTVFHNDFDKTARRICRRSRDQGLGTRTRTRKETRSKHDSSTIYSGERDERTAG